jgi:hypothetical protein
MFVGICAAILAVAIVSDGSKLASLICGVPHRTIQYLPLIGRQFLVPTSGETELTEMSFREGAVAEASFDNQKSFSIEQIVIRDAGIGVGKASQLQIMPFGWFGQWPSSDTYGYRYWGHRDFFTNVIRANCPSSFGWVLQKGGIKSRIFRLPHGQIQGWFFADIDITEIDEERLPESGFSDIRVFWNDPSARATNHRVAADFYASRDQSCLPISDSAAVGYQFIGQVRQTLSFDGGNGSRSKGEDEDDKARPIQGIMLFGCGVFLGAMGIFLAVIIAPVRGDAWGFAGLALIPVGLIICYFSGGFFVAHLAPLDPAIIDPVISGYPTRSAPDRRSSRSSMIRTISVIDHSFVVTPAAIAGVTRKL